MKNYLFGGLLVLIVCFVTLAGCVSIQIPGSGQSIQAPVLPVLTQITAGPVSVHNGIDSQRSSAIEILGNVYGDSADGTSVDKIKFTIGLVSGASPIDMTKTVMTFSTVTSVETLTFKGKDTTNSGTDWVIASVEKDNGSNNAVLDSGEQFTIIAAPTRALNAYDSFTLDIKPPVGASLGIHRTIPASVDKVNLLY